MGKIARTTRTVTEGRALRESRARVRDGFWYTENMSRAFPPPPLWDSITAATASFLREAMSAGVAVWQRRGRHSDRAI